MASSRRWRLVSFEVPSIAAEVCGAWLVERLGVGISEERVGGGSAPGPVGARVWLTAYLPDEPDAPGLGEALAGLRVLLGDIGMGTRVSLARNEWIIEQAWADEWRKHARPIRVGERLLILPSWVEAPGDEGLAVVRLDPGIAFGAGSHISTRLALELMETRVAPGCSVADVGCGSGILSVAAALLGAGSVVAVDVDPLAVEATAANAERNGAGHLVRATELDGPPAGRYDLVVANIAPKVIAALMPAFAGAVRSAGSLVLSGILEERAPEVLDAAEGVAGLQLAERVDREGWTGLVFRGCGDESTNR